MLLLLMIAVASGAWVATRPAPQVKGLTLWTFSAGHAQADRTVLASFAEGLETGVSVESMSDRAENLRLQSIFLDPPSNRAVVPDIVEIEIGQLGRFFRPPADEVGLLPLNERLRAGGLADQFQAARLATWSKDGQIFGLPLDVHPVALAYRADLFEQAGVDLAGAKTWPEFQDACLHYQDYCRAQGWADRWAVDLSRTSSDTLSILLLQQRIDLIDRAGRVRINQPRVAETLAFYARLVAGSRRIGVESGPSAAQVQDVSAGRIAVFVMPDWRIHEFKSRFPQLAGKMRLLPLPRFAPGDAPTASWGGTMIGIPRAAPNPELAWQAVCHLLFSPQAAAERARQETLSAVPAQWDADGTHPDSYFQGQEVRALLVSLARGMPSPAVDPETVIARAELSVALSAAIAEIDRGNDAKLLTDCQGWLDWAAADLSARIAQGRLAS